MDGTHLVLKYHHYPMYSFQVMCMNELTDAVAIPFHLRGEGTSLDRNCN